MIIVIKITMPNFFVVNEILRRNDKLQKTNFPQDNNDFGFWLGLVCMFMNISHTIHNKNTNIFPNNIRILIDINSKNNIRIYCKHLVVKDKKYPLPRWAKYFTPKRVVEEIDSVT